MFALVALMCLYLGIKNLYCAFVVPFKIWGLIHWLLLVTGAALLIVAFFCVRQATKDLKLRRQKSDEGQPEDK
ncbi:MAG: hypothetical protein RR846_05480 [Oscillospiraceae bacterium]